MLLYYTFWYGKLKLTFGTYLLLFGDIFMEKLHHSGWETLKWRPRVTKDQLEEVNSKQNHTSNVILLTSEVLLEDISAQKNTLVIEGVGRSL